MSIEFDFDGDNPHESAAERMQREFDEDFGIQREERDSVVNQTPTEQPVPQPDAEEEVTPEPEECGRRNTEQVIPGNENTRQRKNVREQLRNSRGGTMFDQGIDVPMIVLTILLVFGLYRLVTTHSSKMFFSAMIGVFLYEFVKMGAGRKK